MHRLAVLISGRGSNMDAIVRHTRSGELANVAQVVVVASNKPDARGLETAQSYGVATEVVPSRGKKRATFERQLIEALRQHQPDLIVLAGFMRVLSSTFVAAFPGRIVNIHPADTSKHQGLGGYDWAFENKLPETRITVHYVDEGLDSGPVIGQHVVDLAGADTLEEVEKRGLTVEHAFYSQMIRKVLQTEDATAPSHREER